MAKFTDDQIAEYQEAFTLFDNKGDGKIYAHQLGEVLRAVGQNPTEAEVKKCGFHQDPDRRISFEQFLPILATISKNHVPPVTEDFIEGFRVFDKDQNATINSAELRHLLTTLGERLTDEEVNELLQGQEDLQGNVNYEEFIKNVLNG